MTPDSSSWSVFQPDIIISASEGVKTLSVLFLLFLDSNCCCCLSACLSDCPTVCLLSGFLWYLQVRLPPTVNLLRDKGKLMDFLLRRRDCKMVILSVCAQSASTATEPLLVVM